MASTTDHIRRDAEHAARNEVSTALGKFVRRINEAAKADLKQRLENIKDGEVIDFDFGTRAGKDAAARAIAHFLYDDPEQVAPRPAGLNP